MGAHMKTSSTCAWHEQSLSNLQGLDPKTAELAQHFTRYADVKLDPTIVPAASTETLAPMTRIPLTSFLVRAFAKGPSCMCAPDLLRITVAAAHADMSGVS